MTARTFPPGSEWLYLKVYGGSETIDALLRYEIGPLCQDIVATGRASKWFFLRYGDPDWHLRVRLNLTSLSAFGPCVAELYKVFNPYLQRQQIHRVVLDTYQREIERYGMEGIHLAERVFHHDSECVLRLCRAIENGGNERWIVGCLGVDRLLTDFGYSPASKLGFMKRLSQSFADEFSLGKAGDIMLGKKYREHGRMLKSMLAGVIPGNVPQEVLHALDARSAEFTRLFLTLQGAKLGTESWPTLDSLVGSYIHVFTNRLFKTSGRKFETVVYDLLHRSYESNEARQRKGNMQ